jgi:hypothetical protein
MPKMEKMAIANGLKLYLIQLKGEFKVVFDCCGMSGDERAVSSKW